MFAIKRKILVTITLLLTIVGISAAQKVYFVDPDGAITGTGLTINGNANVTGTLTCGVGCGGGSSYNTVEDEGGVLTQRNNLNFIGPNIVCADNNGTSVTDCTLDASISSVLADTTPQLGGALDVNNFGFTSATGLDISIGGAAGNDFTIDTNKFLVEGDTGFIGMGGVAAPANTLEILTTSAPQLRLTQTLANRYATFEVKSLGTLTMAMDGINDQLVLSDGGNVGINVNLPSTRLHINGNMLLVSNVADPIFFLGESTSTSMRFTWDRSNNYLRIGAGGQTALSLSGALTGIGITTEPNQTFQLGSGATTYFQMTSAGAFSYPQGYNRTYKLSAGASTTGGTAPSPTTVGTMRGLAFNATAELAFIGMKIPTDWDPTTAINLVIHWIPTDGDTPLNGETVRFDIQYHSAAIGEAVDQGTVAIGTVTYTQSGAGIPKGIIESTIVLPASSGNQPLAIGDDLNIRFNRNTVDTYSGDPNVFFWTFEYTSIGLPEL